MDGEGLYNMDVDPAIYQDMKPWEMYYAGISSEDIGFVVGHYSKPIAPLLTRSAVDVPGRFGDLYLGTSYGAKTFSIPITIIADGADDYYRIHENMSKAFLDPFEEPGTVYPIVFGDDPHKAEYYGHFTEIPDPQFVAENVWTATTTLTFVCADPKGYLPEEDIQITEPVTNIEVKGNSETYPIIHAVMKKPTEHFGYVKDNEYVAVGVDKDYDTTDTNYIQDNEKWAYYDPCDSIDNFTVGQPTTFEITNGYHAGSVVSTGTAIKVADKNAKNPNGQRDYGKAVKKDIWHGPVITHDAVSNPTTDWEMSFRFDYQKFYSRSMGKLEMYLLDTDGKRRGRFAVKNGGTGRAPGVLFEFGNVTGYEAGKRHYFIGGENEPYAPKKGQHNGANKQVVITNKEKVKVTYYKKSGRTKVKKTKYVWETKTQARLKDYNNSSVFSDIFGQFDVRKVGDTVTWWIAKLSAQDNSPKEKIAQGTWKMSAEDQKKFDFTLSKVAFFMGKMDIVEDGLNPAKTYREHFMAITDLRVKNIVNGGNSKKDKPSYILQKGDEIIIDCERKHVYINNEPVDYLTDIGSTFPTWNRKYNEKGTAEVAFFPDPGDAMDLEITYRPTYQ